MKFSDFWNAVIRMYEDDGVDLESMYDPKLETLKENYRVLWHDGVEPEEAYERLS